MAPSKFLQNALLSFTVGGAFLGLSSISDDALSELPGWAAIVFSYLWIPGIILLLAGFALFAAHSLGSTIEHFLENSKYYDCRKAKTSDLKNIFEMADELFDWDISPIESMKRWQTHNSTLFWVIEKYEVNKKSKKKTFEGYFCVIPITKEATSSLLSGNVNGSSFEKSHIVPEGGYVENVYIGGIAATSRNAKGFAMMGLKQYLNYLLENGLKRIITRPVSQDGMRVALDHGFISVGPNNGTGNLFEIQYNR